MWNKSRVAVVTGAARGIGKQAAIKLAEAGAAVGVIDMLPEVEETAREAAAHGKHSVTAVLDIADPEQVRDGVEKIRRDLGDPDILVNNAAIVGNIAWIRTMEHHRWEREISVNLGGSFNMIKAVIDGMLQQHWGRIINVSSAAALGGLHKQVSYASSKAGVLGMTKTVALEHARDGITCNAILPGLIETELVQLMPAEIREKIQSGIPAGRLGAMDEVAHLIVFLASDRAAYINGAEIKIDGGITLNVGTLGSRKELKKLDI